MPTYEYACRACGEHIEVVQSFRDDPLDTCGACGGALRKVFSAAGIIFKGSGYYVTDTRSERSSASSGSGASSTGSDKQSSRSEGSGDAAASSSSSSDSSSSESSAEKKSA